MKIAVIIPAYNEEVTIADVLRQFAKYHPEATLWVIDNNSSDRTSEVAKKVIQELGAAGGVIFEPVQGKANAVRTAFRQIDADVYGLIDADGTYPIAEFIELLKPVQFEAFDLVIGDRISKGDYQKVMDRPLHLSGNRMVTQLINSLFGSNITDFLSGYRVMSRKFVKHYPVMCAGFELEVEMTIHALDKRFKVKEVQTSFAGRPVGSFSKLDTVRDGIKIVKTIFLIFKDYYPLRFFGTAAAIFAFAGLVAGIPVIFEFIQTLYITHIPLAVLASGLMLFSVILLSIGLILDTVVKNYRFMYELEILRD